MVLGVHEACWQFRSERIGRREAGRHWNDDYYQDRTGLPRHIFFFFQQQGTFTILLQWISTYSPPFSHTQHPHTHIRERNKAHVSYHQLRAETQKACMVFYARNIGLLRKYVPLVVVVVNI